MSCQQLSGATAASQVARVLYVEVHACCWRRRMPKVKQPASRSGTCWDWGLDPRGRTTHGTAESLAQAHALQRSSGAVSLLRARISFSLTSCLRVLPLRFRLAPAPAQMQSGSLNSGLQVAGLRNVFLHVGVVAPSRARPTDLMHRARWQPAEKAPNLALNRSA